MQSDADVAALIHSDPRLADWSFVDRGAGYMEIAAGEVFLVLLWPERWRDPAERAVHLVRARSGSFGLLLFGSDGEFADAAVDRIDCPGLALVPTPVAPTRLAVTLRAARRALRHSREVAALELDLERSAHENDLLISIGRALSQQRNLRSLLELILSRTREVTGADAGSIYVITDPDAEIADCGLRFMVSQNDSVTTEYRQFTMPVSSKSIVGSCVIERRPINIVDLYKDTQGYVHDRSFDEKHGYQTRSLLTVPMISARQRVIGVIQLINKRARGFMALNTPGCFEAGIIPFDEVSVNYATALASQAGIALENAMLYDEVTALFEGFVKASVQAIESRDPTTSGHSERVADLTVGLAETADKVASGPYAALRFSREEMTQIRYAALLHDFGKVGVREHVLVKAKKLYEHQRDLILQRFAFIRKTLENEVLASKLAYAIEASRERTAAELSAQLAEFDASLSDRLTEIDAFVRFVLEANEPTVLEQGGFERISDIAARRYVDTGGAALPYLTPEEASALQILRGSLTGDERREIESHVKHTYEFLKQIPWGRTFRDVPEIAGAHHEKLDGSGYPNGLPGASIPPPARMMTISDIYDALTASDRPYKKAMPPTRALDILGAEVKSGRLDPDLYQLFVDAEVYRLTRDRLP